MASWQPSDVRRLISLVAGIGFFITGVGLMLKGISSGGSIDIQSALVSGKIQTGSAGLFIAFLATLIIIFSAATSTLTGRSQAEGPSNDAPSTRSPFYVSPATMRAFWVLLALSGVIAVLAWLSMRVPRDHQTAVAVIVGALLVLGIAAALVFIHLLLTIFDTDDQARPGARPPANPSAAA